MSIFPRFFTSGDTCCARPGVGEDGVVERLADGSRLACSPGRAPARRAGWPPNNPCTRGAAGTSADHGASVDESAGPDDRAGAGVGGAVCAAREQELDLRTVKRHLRKTDLLQSHTVETGAQGSRRSCSRARCSPTSACVWYEDAPAPRLRAAKVLRVTTALWLAVQIGAGVLSDEQITEILTRGSALMRRYLKPPRRPRSCPRAVRQPVRGWPRLLTRASINGAVEITLV